MRSVNIARTLASLGAAFFFSGCGVEPSSDFQESPTIEMQTGIGSAFASPTKTYLSKRRIGTLTELGALSTDQATTANRVDGIIKNQPANGSFSTAELLQIEQPGYIEFLLPNEKAALPYLWSLLETDASTPVSVGVQPLSYKDVSVEPGSLTTPTTLAIATLPTELQASAQRLQLGFDADSDSTTISLVDLETAIAAPGPFLPAELQQFVAIRDRFLALGTSTLQALLEVPDPEVADINHGPFAEGDLIERHQREYRTEVSYNRTSYSGGDVQLSHLRLSDQLLVTATVLPNDQVATLCLDNEDERQVTAASAAVTVPLETGSQPCVLEHWRGGVRLATRSIDVGEVAILEEANSTKDWAVQRYVRFDLVLADGTPLEAHTVEATYSGPSAHTNTRAYREVKVWTKPGGSVAPSGAGIDSEALAVLSKPQLTLPPGRYTVNVPTIGTCKVDLYPQKVMRVTIPAPFNNQAYGWIFVWEDVAKFDARFPNKLRFLLNPASSELHVFFDGQGTLLKHKLTLSDRTN